jgi:L-alanine-DL-glutamate epimerase-like enolase superfamily enzyme
MKSDPLGSSMGWMTPEDEDLAIDFLAAVREAAGRHALLAIEAHSCFTPSSAIRIVQRLEPW